MIAKITTVGLAVVALGLVGYGGWLWFRPLGFLIPGILLWIDISRGGN
jgi:hypothetical protein